MEDGKGKNTAKKHVRFLGEGSLMYEGHFGTGGERMEGFEEIYRTYFGDVYRYVLRLCGGDSSLAEEITSETFLRALRAIDRFRGDCQLRIWLCQIAKNCFRSRIARPSSLSLDSGLSDTLASPEQIEEDFLDRSDAIAIHRALHALPEPYKEVFSLRIFGELSFRQIGQLFGKTDNWACVTYHRAKRKIMEQMEE